MKHIEIKDLLKKELLILELPRVCDYELDEEMLWVINLENGFTYRAEGSYTLLGKPDEIKEEDAMELVETDEISDVEDYRYQITFIDYKDEENSFPTAKESLLSLLDTEIYWDVNPMEKPPKNDLNGSFFTMQQNFHKEIQYDEAEQKTFDRNRSIILVKIDIPTDRIKLTENK